MAKLRKRTTGTYRLELDRDEIDVVYRLLKSTKKNEDVTRLSVVNDILDVVDTVYAKELSFEENERLSTDHFGEVCFSHDARIVDG